ncbi:hypothetical protein GCM10009834_17490 [Streptomonospora arabica]
MPRPTGALQAIPGGVLRCGSRVLGRVEGLRRPITVKKDAGVRYPNFGPPEQ